MAFRQENCLLPGWGRGYQPGSQSAEGSRWCRVVFNQTTILFYPVLHRNWMSPIPGLLGDCRLDSLSLLKLNQSILPSALWFQIIIALSPIFCPFWHPSDEKLCPPISVRLWKAKVENYLVNSPPLSRSLSTNVTVTNPTTFAKKSMGQNPRDYSPVLQGSCSTGNAHSWQGCQKWGL